jgi:hypothetical protein
LKDLQTGIQNLLPSFKAFRCFWPPVVCLSRCDNPRMQSKDANSAFAQQSNTVYCIQIDNSRLCATNAARSLSLAGWNEAHVQSRLEHSARGLRYPNVTRTDKKST